MYFPHLSVLTFSVCINAALSSAELDVGGHGLSSNAPDRRDAPAARGSNVSQRGEPDTGGDFPNTDPSPNQLHQVETAIKDAWELTSYVIMFIDTVKDIFP